MRKRKVIIDEWRGCYPSRWNGIIVPEAMSHPAKYSSKLIQRIYEHMLEQGWVKEGDNVLDPFGGVALGALDAMRLGLHWTGNELEEKFWKLGNQNIDRWNTQYQYMPHWGTARLLHGDSRYLLSVIDAAVQVSVSSPPFEGGQPLANPTNTYKGFEHVGSVQLGQDGYGETPGQLGAMPAHQFDAAISSPPFLQSEGGAKVPSDYADDPTFMARHAAGNKSSNAYGDSNGQLSSMRDSGFDAAISSPPFGEALSGGGIARKGYQNEEKRKGSNDEPFDLVGKRSYMPENQGETPGQLSTMSMDSFDAAVSSPPFERNKTKDNGEQGAGWYEGKDLSQAMNRVKDDYHPMADMGEGADFWLAARAIVEQVYAALVPGGHAVWVVKDYVKNKNIVPFSHQWETLCEAVGFVTLHEHHAMLVHHKGTQHTLEGGTVEKKTESKSFFRRLAEKKGSPRIDFETVFCMVKPEG